MLWYKIGNRFIDLHKVEEFGYSSSDTIHVVFSDKTDINYYDVEDAEKEMAKFAEFIVSNHLNTSPWAM